MSKQGEILKESEVENQNTPAVLAYRVGQLEKKVEQGFTDIKEQNAANAQKIDIYLHSVATKSDIEAVLAQKSKDHDRMETAATKGDEALAARIDKIDNWLVWAGRLIIGAVIAAVLGLVVWTQ